MKNIIIRERKRENNLAFQSSMDGATHDTPVWSIYIYSIANKYAVNRKNK